MTLDVTSGGPRSINSEPTECANTLPALTTIRLLVKGQVMAESQSTDSLPSLPIVEGVEVRHVPGFLGYAVGDDGTVWSCRKRSGHMEPGSNFTNEWTMKRHSTSRYCHISAFLGDGKSHTCGVHRLVLLAFIGPCPAGMESLHENGNRHDNRLANLRWGTKKENAEDRERHGTAVKGERQHLAKLTETDVRAIRRIFTDERLSFTEIGRRYGVPRRTIACVVRGLTWMHVSDEEYELSTDHSADPESK